VLRAVDRRGRFAVDPVVCGKPERARVELEHRGTGVDVGGRELQSFPGDVESGVAAVMTGRANADCVGRINR